MEFKKVLKIRVTFTEEALGTLSDRDTFGEHILPKAYAPEAEDAVKEVKDLLETEGDALPETEDDKPLGKTVFPRTDDGKPFIYDYQWRGFFKEAGKAMNRIPTSLTKKLKAFIKIVDTVVFVKADVPADVTDLFEKRKLSRQCILNLPEGAEVGICQRPLRGQTAKGERVAIATSETVPAGTTCTFNICLLDDALEKVVKEWLNYGEEHGTLQWRNSGKGSFVWEQLDEDGKVIDGNL